MNKEIKRLINYALTHKFIEKEDIQYSINRILDLLNLSEYKEEEVSEEFDIDVIMKPLLDYAVKMKIIKVDTVSKRDIFEAKLLDACMPRPSEVTKKFKELYKVGSEKATDYYYELSKRSNYIKTSRTDKNIIWKSKTKYGIFDMTINLSKPEKDPKDIIKAGKTSVRSYPKCLLCIDNVGYNGDTTNIGRTNHRVIPVRLNNEEFNLQYSPYVYYNEHSIVFHKEHTPMNVSEKTFRRLFDFIDMFPHYFLGSNAGLPIVGGSILSHEHYQGGRHHFPIEDAEVLSTNQIGDIVIKKLYWPLSVIRLESKNKESLISAGMKLYDLWSKYTNQEAGILAHTDAPHNAITPISRKNGEVYILDMTLRNNRTSDKYPLGIFHPHPENHHIKKENIGLIEVMGLAVLPARLSKELPIIKDCILNRKEIPSILSAHSDWLTYLKEKYTGEDIDAFLNDEVALKFMNCIENSGVFKNTEEGSKQFDQFLMEYINVLRK